MGPEDKAGRRNGPEQFQGLRIGFGTHGSAGLGAEVLDYDLLDVAVGLVEFPNGEEGFDALPASLADADEYPAGKGYPQLAGDLGGAEPDAGALAGGELVGATLPRYSRGLTLSSMRPMDGLKG